MGAADRIAIRQKLSEHVIMFLLYMYSIERVAGRQREGDGW